MVCVPIPDIPTRNSPFPQKPLRLIPDIPTHKSIYPPPPPYPPFPPIKAKLNPTISKEGPGKRFYDQRSHPLTPTTRIFPIFSYLFCNSRPHNHLQCSRIFANLHNVRPSTVYFFIRSMIPVVDRPCKYGAKTTFPPRPSTVSRPTTSFPA